MTIFYKSKKDLKIAKIQYIIVLILTVLFKVFLLISHIYFMRVIEKIPVF